MRETLEKGRVRILYSSPGYRVIRTEAFIADLEWIPAELKREKSGGREDGKEDGKEDGQWACTHFHWIQQIQQK